MQETLHDDHTSIPISGRLISNLRIADDIHLMGSTSKVSMEKSNIRVNSTTITTVDITMIGGKLD
ncbi:hypothetical protein DPMN_087611 [Dreissena polymorpha]|uniref:Uncharacterized protein n=1 Tax=Dreissena polymorpha TaxID=45954 RepID=A0A9D4KSP2_DREPO|nr:hypothetical protein DPMN_087611 [Dreissena polymorpha]